ncbi:MAG TPA: AAA family ATPase [Pirellulales bacterium]|nr:AAA family ATPase [Pirellulales bacterium]
MTATAERNGAPTHGRLRQVDDLLDAPPPHDRDAEQALLASVLYDPRVIGDVAAILPAAAMHMPQYRRTYEAMLAIHAAGALPDVVMLTGRLTADGAMGHVGGIGALTEIAESAATASNATHYAGVVARRAEQRRAMLAGMELLRHAADDRMADGDIADWRAGVTDITAPISRRAETTHRLRRMTMRELAAADLRTHYLIDGVLAAGQTTIIGGAEKAGKTTITLAAAVAMTTGRPWLGHYAVPRPVRVAVQSGESGMATLRETVARIALADGIDYRDIEGLTIGDELPTLGAGRADVDRADELLDTTGADVWMLDPAYLCVDADGREGSLFAVGAALRPVTELCQRRGVTLVLLHHTRRPDRRDEHAPCELADLSWGGYRQWARQWILLARREPYLPGTGQHQLWLSIGGSAGHSDLAAVDIDEGTWPARTWCVSVTRGAEARQDAKARQEQAKQAERQVRASVQLDADRKAIVAAMAKIGKPEMATKIRDWAGLGGGKRFPTVWATLLSDGTVIEAGGVVAGNHKPAALYSLKKDTDK